VYERRGCSDAIYKQTGLVFANQITKSDSESETYSSASGLSAAVQTARVTEMYYRSRGDFSLEIPTPAFAPAAKIGAKIQNYQNKRQKRGFIC
jgi:hypothetical protein